MNHHELVFSFIEPYCFAWARLPHSIKILMVKSPEKFELIPSDNSALPPAIKRGEAVFRYEASKTVWAISELDIVDSPSDNLPCPF